MLRHVLHINDQPWPWVSGVQRYVRKSKEPAHHSFAARVSPPFIASHNCVASERSGHLDLLQVNAMLCLEVKYVDWKGSITWKKVVFARSGADQPELPTVLAKRTTIFSKDAYLPQT